MTAALVEVATIVDWKALAESSLAALISGTVFTLAFSLAIVGASRAIEYSRNERRWEAVFAGILGGMALVVSLGLVAAGLIVMLA
jgi:hypothetical protein